MRTVITAEGVGGSKPAPPQSRPGAVAGAPQQGPSA